MGSYSYPSVNGYPVASSKSYAVATVMTIINEYKNDIDACDDSEWDDLRALLNVIFKAFDNVK